MNCYNLEKDLIKSLKMVDTYIELLVSKGDWEAVEKVKKYFTFMSAAAKYNERGNIEMYKSYRNLAKQVLQKLNHN